VNIVREHLARAGYKVATETDSERGLERATAGDVDLIVLDVMLPSVSGFEVCRRIRRNSEIYTLPILILSGMNDHEEIIHGLEQGADDYMTKPFEMKTLIQHIEALLRFNSEHPSRDNVTSMLSGDGVKREVQRRVIDNQLFALAYAEMLQIREFGFRCSNDDRARAIRHFGRTLDQVGKHLKAEAFIAGHMGGGHFVCMMPVERAETYCAHVRKVWLEHLEEFYTSIGQQKAYQLALQKGPSPDAIPILDVLFCVTYRQPEFDISAKRMFETLTHMRSRAINGKISGLFVDRRATASLPA